MKAVIASLLLLIFAVPAALAGSTFYETAEATCPCGANCPHGDECTCGADCKCPVDTRCAPTHCVLGREYFYPKVPVRVPRRPRGYVWHYQPTGLLGLLGGGRRVHYQEW